jgi:hypothetical protein
VGRDSRGMHTCDTACAKKSYVQHGKVPVCIARKRAGKR